MICKTLMEARFYTLALALAHTHTLTLTLSLSPLVHDEENGFQRLKPKNLHTLQTFGSSFPVPGPQP